MSRGMCVSRSAHVLLVLRHPGMWVVQSETGTADAAVAATHRKNEPERVIFVLWGKKSCYLKGN